MQQPRITQAAHGPIARLAGRLPFFYGWIIVYIGFLGVFLSGATSFWGLPVFVGPMHQDTGWSHASIFGGIALRSLVAAACGLFAGRLADRRGGPSLMLLAGLLIDGSAMASLRWVQSPAEFLLLYGVVGGIGSTGLRLLQATLVPKWFVARRGTAVGFASMGGGMSALIMVPVVSLLVDELGWRDAWAALALIMALLVLPCVPLAVRAPEDIGLRPDNGVAPRQRAGRPRVTAETEQSFTLAQAVRTWRLWLLLLAMAFGSYSLNVNTLVLVPYFEEIGFSAAVAASGVSVYGLFSVFARFIWGGLADRLTARPAIAIQASLTGGAALLLLQIGGTSSLYGAVAVQGVVLGGFPTLQSLIWPEFFGRRHIGAIIGMTQLFTTLAAAGGSVAAGWIHDTTGTYAANLWLVAATWLICAALTMAVRPGRQPQPLRSASPEPVQ